MKPLETPRAAETQLNLMPANEATKSHEIMVPQVLKCSWSVTGMPLHYSHSSELQCQSPARYTYLPLCGCVCCMAGLFSCHLKTPVIIYLHIWGCSDATQE